MNKNKNTIILSDSICDLGKDLLEKYSIDINPLIVVKDGKEYLDTIEINPDDIYEYYNETGKLCSTSAINVQTCADFLNKYTSQGKGIVYFSLSSEMSSSFNNAVIASEGMENVFVVDTWNISTGSGLLVLAAAEMAEQGKTAKEIYDRVMYLRECVDASYVVDNLEFLHKGGRCSSIAALGANILKLRPCIDVKFGKMAVCKKYRGKMSDVLKTYCKDRLTNIDDIDLTHVFITHSGCDEETVNEISALVKETAPFKNVYVTRAGCTVSAHCGPKTLGVLFIRKSPIK